MASLNIRRYDQADEAAWEGLVATSCNGTFLHTRRFLSYHGDRFVDLSLVVEDGRGRLRGVFPAAQDPDRPEGVTSHPGITYGGLVHDGTLRGERTIDVLTAIRDHYRAAGLRSLRYRSVPWIYHRVTAEDDLYALWRLGASLARCDLSAAVDVHAERTITRARKKRQRRASRNDVTAEWGWEHAGEFWDILCANLKAKHGTAPVHSLDEMRHLASLFPEEIAMVAARSHDAVLAGGIVFLCGSVVHIQYSSANAEGLEVGGMDVVVEACVDCARQRGSRFVDFGNSNESEGHVLNDSLYGFKVSFGGGGVVYGQYEIDLAAP